MAMLKVQIDRETAAVILEVLEGRLEDIQKLEGKDGLLLAAHVRRDREAIVSTIMAIEASLKVVPPQ
jgi:hypothetical protein